MTHKPDVVIEAMARGDEPSQAQAQEHHTPGPWHIIPHPSEGTKCATIASAKALEYADGHATVWSDYSGANARLIAAAPELLGAAQYLSEFYEHFWFDMSKVTDGEMQAMKRAWGHMDAAISKATGQPSDGSSPQTPPMTAENPETKT